MRPVLVVGIPLPNPHQVPAQPPVNPALQVPIVAPQITTVGVPADPLQRKRVREAGDPGSEEPVFKQARTEPVVWAVDPNQQALIDAIKGGDVDSVTILIRSFPRLLNKPLPVDKGLTPLCLAAQQGQIDIAKSLLVSGALVDAQSDTGSNPLIFAAAHGDVNMIHLLRCFGAALHATNPLTGSDALTYAIKRRNLEACKLLIDQGADLQRRLVSPINKIGANTFTPLFMVLAFDFPELLAWWLDRERLPVDTREVISGLTLINLAICRCKNSVAVVRMLMERGANFNCTLSLDDGRRLSDIWAIAACTNQDALIEYLLSVGQRPNLEDSGVPSFYKLKIGSQTDLCIHLTRQTNSKAPADCLADENCRQHPERSIEDFARNSPLSSTSDLTDAILRWSENRWLASLITLMLNNESIAFADFLGQNKHFTRPLEKSDQPTPAQQLHIVIESLSNLICAPSFSTMFNELKMTPQGTQKMNQIAIAQGELLLKGIARLRKRFEQQVATLPQICVGTYIALSHQLNEPDLYRHLTQEWGLYDPVARAVVRLVKEAYSKLREVKPEKLPAEFTAMSLDEQLRHVMVDSLEEWDKIPEVTQAFRQFAKSEQLDVASELLFQQWRLFGEALGVTKPRYSPFGPHKATGVEPEPVMEVDHAPLVVAAAASSEVSLNPQ
jgi:ankyrin repeat protein